MTNQETIELIQTRISEIDDLSGLNKEHRRFAAWLENSIEVIKGIENLPQKYLTDFTNLPFQEVRVNPGCNLSSDDHDISRYKEDLQIAKVLLESIIDQLKMRKD